MAASRLPLWGTVAGVVVGTVVAVGLVVAGPLDVPQPRDTSDASADLVAAWERSRNATVIVRSDFSRRQADGQTLRSRTELVQRPPDRLVRSFGGVSGTVGGHPIVCSTDPIQGFRCFSGTAEAPPYADTVRTELETLRSYFVPPEAGAKPLYRVMRGLDPGCFELFQQFAYPDAPYGTYAKFCFDERTGARSLLERHLENRTVEIEQATSIDDRVTDGDFDTSTNEGFDPTMEGLPGETQGTLDLTPGTVPAGTVPSAATVPPTTDPSTGPSAEPATDPAIDPSVDEPSPAASGGAGAAPATTTTVALRSAGHGPAGGGGLPTAT